MDKLDYLIVGLAFVLQGSFAASVMYLYADASRNPARHPAMTALHEKLSALHAGRVTDPAEVQRTIGNAQAALYGLEQHVARLRYLYRQAGVLAAVCLFCYAVVIYRLH